MELVWCNFPSQKGYQFALKQTAAFHSELNSTERRPGRINVMMRALDGDWEGDLGVRDKQTLLQLQLSLMGSFIKYQYPSPLLVYVLSQQCFHHLSQVLFEYLTFTSVKLIKYQMGIISGKRVNCCTDKSVKTVFSTPQTTTSCSLECHFW